MKKIIASILLLVIVLSCGVIWLHNLKESSEKIDDLITKTISALRANQKITAKKYYDSIEKEWETQKALLHMMIDHVQLKRIEEALVSAKSMIMSDELSQAVMYLSLVQEEWRELYEREMICIENIL